MKKRAGYILAAFIGIAIGYFAGREHIKYEMRSAFQSAAEGISESFSSAFGDTTELEQGQQTTSGRPERAEVDPSIAAYIADNLELYDVSAKYMNAALDGKVPGVLFKIRNNGEQSLDRVEVTIYFKDASGRIIAEEDYHPVLVSEYSFSGDNKPLKPGYVWQMERGKFYSAKKVPDEWAEGQIDAAITNIKFAE
jgi:hypothetical protein